MSEDDIYIRVDEPDTEFTTEEWNNYRDIPTHEQAQSRWRRSPFSPRTCLVKLYFVIG